MVGLAIMALAMFGFAALRARADRESRAAVDRAAELLGLDPRGGEPGQIVRGVVDEVELALALDGARLSVTIAPRHPRIADVCLLPSAGFPPVPTRRDFLSAQGRTSAGARHAPWEPMSTGDDELDLRAGIDGDEAAVHALLDHDLRARLIEALTHHTLQIEGRALHASRAIDEGTDGAVLAAWVRSMIELARALRELDGDELRRRLHQNATTDPEPGVRTLSLVALLDHLPGSEEASRAAEHVRAHGDPASKLVLAVRSGDEPLLLEVVASAEVASDLLVEALIERATTSPSRHVELFRRALTSPAPEIQLYAVGALNMLDLALVPVEDVLDRFDDLGRRATDAALRLLARVPEEGRHLDPTVRARAIQRLVEHGALDDAEAGRLALVPLGTEGALSLEKEGGAVSVAPPDERG